VLFADEVKPRTQSAWGAARRPDGLRQRPQAPPPDPSRTAAAFAARRLDALPADAALAGATWSLQQWFDAALRLNPQLAESRAHVFAVAAAERTAAEHPNPAMDLFGEYVDTAARSGAWLYGVSLDFLLRRPGDRARARRNAAVQTAVAESDLAEAIQVRALDTVEIIVDDEKNGRRYSPSAKGIQELAASIVERGQIQPVLVQKTSQGYELILGFRRVRAIMHANEQRMTTEPLKVQRRHRRYERRGGAGVECG